MQSTSTQITIAPLLLRVSAVVIDIAILIVAGFALIAAVEPDALSSDGSVSQSTFAIGVITGALYHIGFNATMSATPGKLAMGLYVADKNGARVRPDTAILRYVVFLAGNFIIIGFFATIGLVIFDPQRRAIHDRVAGTLVLRRPQGAEVPPPDFSN
jgi:uncharacterized RDD family membrane protein YckC